VNRLHDFQGSSIDPLRWPHPPGFIFTGRGTIAGEEATKVKMNERKFID